MNGKSVSLPVGTIQDFCENSFHFFLCLKLGVLEMFRLFLCLHQWKLFGIDIAGYTNGLTNNGDVNEKSPETYAFIIGLERESEREGDSG
jgi:hypothetical protein